MASFVEVSAATEADCIHAQNEAGGQRRSMLQLATRNSNRQAEVQGSYCPVGGPWLRLPTPNHVGKAHSCRRRGLCFMPLGLCAGHVPLQGICPSEQLLPLLWRYVACTCFVLALHSCRYVARCLWWRNVGWNVVQLDMACVVNGMLVWVLLHSKEAIAGFHLKFHRWNVKIFVNQLGERREGDQPGVTCCPRIAWRRIWQWNVVGCRPAGAWCCTDSFCA